MKGWHDMTPEEWRAWIDKWGDDPAGCICCGAIAGCCKDYPNCPGNPEFMKTPKGMKNDAISASDKTDDTNVRPAVDGEVRDE